MSRREELLADAAFNALIRLPERERLLAIMHFVMGMAPRAIAAAIGLTARSVSTAIG
jgi:DNA-directed RNA polymerase specialized sigma24 family protein